MKKIGLIALIVVLSLGIIGVGYAAWSQTLTISGTVAAAKFDVKFTANSDPAAPPTGGAVTSSIADPLNATLDITNVYPGYTGAWTFTVTNGSTIPVSATLTETSDAGVMFSAVPAGPITIGAGGTQVYTVTILVPNTWTGSANSEAHFTAGYSIVANQAP